MLGKGKKMDHEETISKEESASELVLRQHTNTLTQGEKTLLELF